MTSDNHNYDSGVVMSLVGEGPRLIIDFVMMNPKEDDLKKDEGEMTAYKRLISRLTKTMKNRCRCL